MSEKVKVTNTTVEKKKPTPLVRKSTEERKVKTKTMKNASSVTPQRRQSAPAKSPAGQPDGSKTKLKGLTSPSVKEKPKVNKEHGPRRKDMKAFVIPRKAKEKELLEEVSLDSNSFQKYLLPAVIQQYRDSKSRASFEYEKAFLVHNEKLENEFQERRKEMKEDGRSDRELAEQYAFLLVDNINIAKLICQDGLQARWTGESRERQLGRGDMGVYLNRYSDILSATSLDPGKEHILLVFKVLKGKVKAVPLAHHKQAMEPTPKFDSHVAKNIVVDMTSSRVQTFVSNQIYCYQFGDLEMAKRPQQVCPFAVVYFKYTEKKETSSVGGVFDGATKNDISTDKDDSAKGAKKPLPYAAVYTPPITLWKGKLINGAKEHCCASLVSSRLPFLPTDLPRRLDLNTAVPISKVKQIMPSDISKHPKLCHFSRYREVSAKGRYFSYAQMKKLGDKTAFVELYKCLKENDVALQKKIENKMMFILPPCNLTEELGLTKSVKSCVLHVLFVSNKSTFKHLTDVGLDKFAPMSDKNRPPLPVLKQPSTANCKSELGKLFLRMNSFFADEKEKTKQSTPLRNLNRSSIDDNKEHNVEMPKVRVLSVSDSVLKDATNSIGKETKPEQNHVSRTEEREATTLSAATPFQSARLEHVEGSFSPIEDESPPPPAGQDPRKQSKEGHGDSSVTKSKQGEKQMGASSLQDKPKFVYPPKPTRMLSRSSALPDINKRINQLTELVEVKEKIASMSSTQPSLTAPPSSGTDSVKDYQSRILELKGNLAVLLQERANLKQAEQLKETFHRQRMAERLQMMSPAAQNKSDTHKDEDAMRRLSHGVSLNSLHHPGHSGFEEEPSNFDSSSGNESEPYFSTPNGEFPSRPPLVMDLDRRPLQESAQIYDYLKDILSSPYLKQQGSAHGDYHQEESAASSDPLSPAGLTLDSLRSILGRVQGLNSSPSGGCFPFSPAQLPEISDDMVVSGPSSSHDTSLRSDLENNNKRQVEDGYPSSSKRLRTDNSDETMNTLASMLSSVSKENNAIPSNLPVTPQSPPPWETLSLVHKEIPPETPESPPPWDKCNEPSNSGQDAGRGGQWSRNVIVKDNTKKQLTVTIKGQPVTIPSGGGNSDLYSLVKAVLHGVTRKMAATERKNDYDLPPPTRQEAHLQEIVLSTLHVQNPGNSQIQFGASRKVQEVSRPLSHESQRTISQRASPRSGNSPRGSISASSNHSPSPPTKSRSSTPRSSIIEDGTSFQGDLTSEDGVSVGQPSYPHKTKERRHSPSPRSKVPKHRSDKSIGGDRLVVVRNTPRKRLVVQRTLQSFTVKSTLPESQQTILQNGHKYSGIVKHFIKCHKKKVRKRTKSKGLKSNFVSNQKRGSLKQKESDDTTPNKSDGKESETKTQEEGGLTDVKGKPIEVEHQLPTSGSKVTRDTSVLEYPHGFSAEGRDMLNQTGVIEKPQQTDNEGRGKVTLTCKSEKLHQQFGAKDNDGECQNSLTEQVLQQAHTKVIDKEQKVPIAKKSPAHIEESVKEKGILTTRLHLTGNEHIYQENEIRVTSKPDDIHSKLIARDHQEDKRMEMGKLICIVSKPQEAHIEGGDEVNGISVTVQPQYLSLKGSASSHQSSFAEKLQTFDTDVGGKGKELSEVELPQQVHTEDERKETSLAKGLQYVEINGTDLEEEMLVTAKPQHVHFRGSFRDNQTALVTDEVSVSVKLAPHSKESGKQEISLTTKPQESHSEVSKTDQHTSSEEKQPQLKTVLRHKENEIAVITKPQQDHKLSQDQIQECAKENKTFVTSESQQVHCKGSVRQTQASVAEVLSALATSDQTYYKQSAEGKKMNVTKKLHESHIEQSYNKEISVVSDPKHVFSGGSEGDQRNYQAEKQQQAHSKLREKGREQEKELSALTKMQQAHVEVTDISLDEGLHKASVRGTETEKGAAENAPKVCSEAMVRVLQTSLIDNQQISRINVRDVEKIPVIRKLQRTLSEGRYNSKDMSDVEKLQQCDTIENKCKLQKTCLAEELQESHKLEGGKEKEPCEETLQQSYVVEYHTVNKLLNNAIDTSDVIVNGSEGNSPQQSDMSLSDPDSILPEIELNLDPNEIVENKASVESDMRILSRDKNVSTDGKSVSTSMNNVGNGGIYESRVEIIPPGQDSSASVLISHEKTTNMEMQHSKKQSENCVSNGYQVQVPACSGHSESACDSSGRTVHEYLTQENVQQGSKDDVVGAMAIPTGDVDKESCKTNVDFNGTLIPSKVGASNSRNQENGEIGQQNMSMESDPLAKGEYDDECRGQTHSDDADNKLDSSTSSDELSSLHNSFLLPSDPHASYLDFFDDRNTPPPVGGNGKDSRNVDDHDDLPIKTSPNTHVATPIRQTNGDVKLLSILFGTALKSPVGIAFKCSASQSNSVPSELELCEFDGNLKKQLLEEKFFQSQKCLKATFSASERQCCKEMLTPNSESELEGEEDPVLPCSWDKVGLNGPLRLSGTDMKTDLYPKKNLADHSRRDMDYTNCHHQPVGLNLLKEAEKSQQNNLSPSAASERETISNKGMSVTSISEVGPSDMNNFKKCHKYAPTVLSRSGDLPTSEKGGHFGDESDDEISMSTPDVMKMLDEELEGWQQSNEEISTEEGICDGEETQVNCFASTKPSRSSTGLIEAEQLAGHDSQLPEEGETARSTKACAQLRAALSSPEQSVCISEKGAVDKAGNRLQDIVAKKGGKCESVPTELSSPLNLNQCEESFEGLSSPSKMHSRRIFKGLVDDLRTETLKKLKEHAEKVAKGLLKIKGLKVSKKPEDCTKIQTWELKWRVKGPKQRRRKIKPKRVHGNSNRGTTASPTLKTLAVKFSKCILDGGTTVDSSPSLSKPTMNLKAKTDATCSPLRVPGKQKCGISPRVLPFKKDYTASLLQHNVFGSFSTERSVQVCHSPSSLKLVKSTDNTYKVCTGTSAFLKPATLVYPSLLPTERLSPSPKEREGNSKEAVKQDNACSQEDGADIQSCVRLGNEDETFMQHSLLQVNNQKGEVEGKETFENDGVPKPPSQLLLPLMLGRQTRHSVHVQSRESLLSSSVNQVLSQYATNTLLNVTHRFGSLLPMCLPFYAPTVRVPVSLRPNMCFPLLQPPLPFLRGHLTGVGMANLGQSTAYRIQRNVAEDVRQPLVTHVPRVATVSKPSVTDIQKSKEGQICENSVCTMPIVTVSDVHGAPKHQNEKILNGSSESSTSSYDSERPTLENEQPMHEVTQQVQCKLDTLPAYPECLSTDRRSCRLSQTSLESNTSGLNSSLTLSGRWKYMYPVADHTSKSEKFASHEMLLPSSSLEHDTHFPSTSSLDVSKVGEVIPDRATDATYNQNATIMINSSSIVSENSSGHLLNKVTRFIDSDRMSNTSGSDAKKLGIHANGTTAEQFVAKTITRNVLECGFSGRDLHVIEGPKNTAIEDAKDAVIRDSSGACIDGSEDAIVECPKDAVIESPNNSIIEAPKYAVIEDAKDDVIRGSSDACIDGSEDAIVECPKDAVIENPKNSIIEAPKYAVLEDVKNDVIRGSSDACIDGSIDPIVECPKDAVIESTKNSIIEAPKYAVIEDAKDDVIRGSSDACIDGSEDAIVESPKDAVIENPKNSIIEAPKYAVIEDAKDDVIRGSSDACIDGSKDPIVECPKDAVTESSKNTIIEGPRDAVTEDFRDAGIGGLEDAVIDGSKVVIIEGPNDVVIEDSTDAIIEGPKDALNESSTDTIIECPGNAVIEDHSDACIESHEDAVVERSKVAVFEYPHEAATEVSTYAISEGSAKEAIIQASSDACIKGSKDAAFDNPKDVNKSSKDAMIECPTNGIIGSPEDVVIKGRSDAVFEVSKHATIEPPEDEVIEGPNDKVIEGPKHASNEGQTNRKLDYSSPSTEYLENVANAASAVSSAERKQRELVSSCRKDCDHGIADVEVVKRRDVNSFSTASRASTEEKSSQDGVTSHSIEETKETCRGNTIALSCNALTNKIHTNDACLQVGNKSSYCDEPGLIDITKKASHSSTKNSKNQERDGGDILSLGDEDSVEEFLISEDSLDSVKSVTDNIDKNKEQKPLSAVKDEKTSSRIVKLKSADHSSKEPQRKVIFTGLTSRKGDVGKPKSPIVTSNKGEKLVVKTNPKEVSERKKQMSRTTGYLCKEAADTLISKEKKNREVAIGEGVPRNQRKGKVTGSKSMTENTKDHKLKGAHGKETPVKKTKRVVTLVSPSKRGKGVRKYPNSAENLKKVDQKRKVGTSSDLIAKKMKLSFCHSSNKLAGFQIPKIGQKDKEKTKQRVAKSPKIALVDPKLNTVKINLKNAVVELHRLKTELSSKKYPCKTDNDESSKSGCQNDMVTKFSCLSKNKLNDFVKTTVNSNHATSADKSPLDDHQKKQGEVSTSQFDTPTRTNKWTVLDETVPSPIVPTVASNRQTRKVVASHSQNTGTLENVLDRAEVQRKGTALEVTISDKELNQRYEEVLKEREKDLVPEKSSADLPKTGPQLHGSDKETKRVPRTVRKVIVQQTGKMPVRKVTLSEDKEKTADSSMGKKSTLPNRKNRRFHPYVPSQVDSSRLVYCRRLKVPQMKELMWNHTFCPPKLRKVFSPKDIFQFPNTAQGRFKSMGEFKHQESLLKNVEEFEPKVTAAKVTSAKKSRARDLDINILKMAADTDDIHKLLELDEMVYCLQSQDAPSRPLRAPHPVRYHPYY